MKSVLISIQPKWCELIASGKKTVEVRKTKPNLDTPFKVYIYMTAGEAVYPVTINGAPYTCSNCGGKVVIGEFVCDRINEITADNLVAIYFNNPQENTCLNDLEMRKYANGKNLFLWHISDLKIYDKPRELRGFYHYCGDNPKCDGCEAHYFSNTECGKEDYCCSIIDGCKPLKRPPQSWCYVEDQK